MNSVHIQRFNDKIKVMNQRQSKDLTLSADDARNLHAAIFDLLAQVSELTAATAATGNEEVITVNMDGGSWSQTS